MIPFRDANTSPRLLQLLQLAELRKVGHVYLDIRQAPFYDAIPDEAWIPLLSQQATSAHPTIVAFSGDNQILESKTQRSLLKAGGFNYVLATDGFLHLKWPDQAWRYLRAWPHLQREIKQRNSPAVYKLHTGRAGPVFWRYIRDL